MPIPNVAQPEYLPIDEALRLHRYEGHCDFALDWYQDAAMVKLVDNAAELYTLDKLTRMYTYLNQKGELYFIEVRENGTWFPVGDVTFWQEDLPIVIGNAAYRGRGIGKKVISALIRRGALLGYGSLFVNEIYDFNLASQKCFTSVGFRPYEKTENGWKYRLNFTENGCNADFFIFP